jgi:hypothetical protein
MFLLVSKQFSSAREPCFALVIKVTAGVKRKNQSRYIAIIKHTGKFKDLIPENRPVLPNGISAANLFPLET